MRIERVGRWLGDHTPLAYGLPAREVDEELVNSWAEDLESSFEKNGVEGIDFTATDLYLTEVNRSVGPEEAAYNMGLAGAAAYRDLEETPRKEKWRDRISRGVRYGEIESRATDARNVSELTWFGFQDYDKLVEQGYEL
ncbi:MAG: hypothetical protein ABEJ91_00565 [Candidatus Nanohaloarchaea archaeon]